jgi:hypothetical protein
MTHLALQLKTRIQNVDIMNNNIEIQKIILNTILSIFGALILLYVLILGNMVFNIVQRGTLEKQSLALSNDVGTLELSYLSLFNGIDVASSASLGFKEIKATFATRKSLGSLKVDKNEI